MEPLRFKLLRVEEEENKDLDACKLLGSPVVPKDFLNKNRLSDNCYFVAQIRCDAFPARPPFPEKGFLYFFVDVTSMKPRVFYTEEEPAEVIDNINEFFDIEACGDPTCLRMVFDEEEKKKIPLEAESTLFGDIDPNIGIEGDTVTAGKLALLTLDGLSLPQAEQRPFIFGDFGFGDGYWVFLIEEEDLRNRNFKRVELIEVEY